MTAARRLRWRPVLALPAVPSPSLATYATRALRPIGGVGALLLVALVAVPIPAAAVEGQLLHLVVGKSGAVTVTPPVRSLVSSVRGCWEAQVDWAVVATLASPPPHRLAIPLAPGRTVTAVLTERAEGTAPALVLTGKLEDYANSSVLLSTYEDALTLAIEGPRFMRFTLYRREDGSHSLCEWDPEKVRTGVPTVMPRIAGRDRAPAAPTGARTQGDDEQ